ncbi:MAG: 3-deoxy-manno-octulosonate cytidylyltransferase [Alphaproteobacteria bacterium]
MHIAVIIPARYGSTRFIGKPLAPIAGISMIERMHRLALAVKGITEVVVATDDERIINHVENFGGRAIMTPENCPNGTERALAACEAMKTKPDVVINLQGDAVLTPPWIIQPLVDVFSDAAVQMATPMVRYTAAQYETLKKSKENGVVGGTTVTFNHQKDALYFSKSIIPFIRGTIENPPIYRHIGLYAYRFSTLARYVTLKQGPFEAVEQLEQLRALEHGIPIRMVEVDYRGRMHWAVDSPADVAIVEEIIAREGELWDA